MNTPNQTSDSWMSRLWHNKFKVLTVLILGSVLYAFVAIQAFDNPKKDFKKLTRLQLEQIKTVLTDFKNVCGRFPTTSQGLEALFKKPTTLTCERYPREGFIEDRPDLRDSELIDHWGQPYKYTSDGYSFRIESSHGVSVEGR